MSAKKMPCNSVGQWGEIFTACCENIVFAGTLLHSPGLETRPFLYVPRVA